LVGTAGPTKSAAHPGWRQRARQALASRPEGATSPSSSSRGGSDGQRWIGELDGLRGLACLSVVLAHYAVPGPFWTRQLREEVLNVSAANLGVVFFYTLSAFLLTYIGVHEYATKGSFSVRHFYIRRCFRIWPLYFTVLAVELVKIQPGGPMHPGLAVGPATWTWINEHLWLYLGLLSNWSLAFNYVGGYVDQSYLLTCPDLGAGIESATWAG
jgi:peptidoglycan/LPS O-acetylase OafA/YrhL